MRESPIHILLAILGVAVGVGLWLWRARIAANAAIETADDIRAAVRRFGYHRKSKVNPLDGIEDARLAAAGDPRKYSLGLLARQPGQDNRLLT